MFRSLTRNIGLRLGLSFALLIAILLAVGWLGFDQSRDVEADREVLRRENHERQLVRDALAYSNLNNRITLQIFLLEERAEIQTLLARREENSKRISALIEEIETHSEAPEEQVLVRAITERRAPYIESYQRALRLLVNDGKPEAARAIMVREALPLIVKYHEAFNEYAAYKRQQIQADEERIGSMTSLTRRGMLTLVCLALLFAILIAVSVMRNLTREMSRRRTAKQELQKAHDELERKIQERTAQLVTANERLVESEQHYRLLFDNNPHPMWLFDTETLVFLAVNETAVRHYGYSREEFLAMTLEDIRLIEDVDDLLAGRDDSCTANKAQARHRKKDGTIFDVEVSWHVLRLANKRAKLVLVNDITDRKATEAQVLFQKARFQQLFETAPLGIVRVDQDDRIIEANKEFERIFQYSYAEIQGVPLNQLIVASQDLQEAVSLSSQTLGGIHVHTEGLRQRKDGTLVPVEIFGVRVISDQRAADVFAIYLDLTKRKEAEEDRLWLLGEIEAQRERLDHILSTIPSVVWEAEIAEEEKPPATLFVNSFVEKMHGYTVAEWLSAPDFWLSTVHPADRKLISDDNHELATKGRGHNEFRWIKKDGTVVWGESQIVAVRDESGKGLRVTGVTTDVTERRRMEEERQIISDIIQGVITTPNLDELLKLIHGCISKVINAENCFVALHDPSTDLMNFEFWVDKFDPCPAPSKIGKGFGSYIVRTGVPLLLDRKLTEDFVRRGEVEQSGTTSASWLGVPLRTMSRTIGVLVVQHYEDESTYTQRDLEFLMSVGGQIGLAIERKRAEQALAEANRRALTEYERLLERIAALGQTLGSARDLTTTFRALRDFAVSSVPCDGLIISLYNKENATRQPTYCWADETEFDPKDVQPIPVGNGMTGQAIKSGTVIINNDFQQHIQTTERPLIVGRCTPTTTPQSALASPMTLMGRTIGCVEIQSYRGGAYQQEHATAMRMAANLAANAVENAMLIEREQAKEEQLRQALKMEAVGRLAGGIAHDFNNLLTAITGYSELTLRKLPPESEHRDRIEEIKKAGDRAASLTRQLLAFSRKQMLQPRVLDLNSVITEMHKMLHRLIGEDIVLQLALGNLLGQVKADPGQIEQILMNLAVNARDAMPQGGQLTIETRNVFLTQTHVNRQLVPQPGKYVMISVSDDGCGMDGKTQAHIFEPFFTTKGVGKGTGLGLSTVYGIVKQSDGGIWVYSEPGKGTAFNICLPRVDELSAAEESTACVDVPGGDETILLVEDEDVVRALSKEVLEQYGYSVISASNGDEGVRICREFAGRIDLVITDVVMPHMSGRELAERIANLRPGMQVLYMSGFTDDAIVRHGLLDEDFAFIQKPFSPESLALKARELLDQNQPALN